MRVASRRVATCRSSSARAAWLSTARRTMSPSRTRWPTLSVVTWSATTWTPSPTEPATRARASALLVPRSPAVQACRVRFAGFERVPVHEDEDRLRHGPAREVPRQRPRELAADAAAADEDHPLRHRRRSSGSAGVTVGTSQWLRRYPSEAAIRLALAMAASSSARLGLRDVVRGPEPATDERRPWTACPWVVAGAAPP